MSATKPAPKISLRTPNLAYTTILLLSMICSSFVAHAAPASESIPFWNDSEPDSAMKVNHTVWQSILNRYLIDSHVSGVNRFAYSAVSEVDFTRLSDYLDYLQALEPRQLNMAEQKAYWINLYNAQTVQLVVRRAKNDKIESIREIRSGIFKRGPWQRELFNISTKKLSLDDVEHGILRPHFNDKRIHYALNCASIGCPNLLKTAYTAENTEALLVKAEADFLSHPRAARMVQGELVLSSLFDWYSTDFANDLDGLLSYLRPFLNATTNEALSSRRDIRFEYDWALNRP